MNNTDKIETEKRTIRAMVKIYCRKMHGSCKTLCESCSSLLNYAEKRLEFCIFGINKPVCKKCTVHCYSVEKRKEIKKIMRESGTVMIFKHPLLTLKHLKNNYGSKRI